MEKRMFCYFNFCNFFIVFFLILVSTFQGNLNQRLVFEVEGWRGVSNLGTQNAQPRFETPSHPATSKATMSASKCRILRFDPPLDVPGSVLSSARQISLKTTHLRPYGKIFLNFGQMVPLREDLKCHFSTWKRVANFFWTIRWNVDVSDFSNF